MTVFVVSATATFFRQWLCGVIVQQGQQAVADKPARRAASRRTCRCI